MQNPQERLTADARLRPFARRPALYLAALWGLVALTVVSVYLAIVFILTTPPNPASFPIDFRVFWAAARLAVMGEPLAAFDAGRMAAIYQVAPDVYMPWLYPPGYLVFLSPLGWLDFAPALLVWTGLSLVIFALALRPFLGGVLPLGILLVLAPAFLPAITLGQNSLYWTAALLAALAALRTGKLWLAGLLFGFLTLKPHLGLMIPFALLALRAWPAILSAMVTMLLLALLPTLIYGLETWPLLLEALGRHVDKVRDQMELLSTMIGPMYLLAAIGLPKALAETAQIVIILVCAAAVVALWRAPRLDFDTKAAGLLAATLLASPYLWYYEGALLPVLALFLLRAGVLALRPVPLLLAGLLWLGAGLQPLNLLANLVDDRWLGGISTPVLVALCLWLCLRRLRAEPLAEITASRSGARRDA